MAKAFKQKVNSSLELDKYVNIETGEELVSELKNNNIQLKVQTSGNFVIIKSDEYTVLDTSAMKYIKELLSRTELGCVIQIAQDLKTPLNIVYNNNVPHTNKTLQEYLGFVSESNFLKLIKKLMKIGVLYQIKGNIMGEVRVIYMFNPFIARKRTTIHKELVGLFDNVTVIKKVI